MEHGFGFCCVGSKLRCNMAASSLSTLAMLACWGADAETGHRATYVRETDIVVVVLARLAVVDQHAAVAYGWRITFNARWASSSAKPVSHSARGRRWVITLPAGICPVATKWMARSQLV